MARTVHYHALFDCDVREAALWYDQRSAGLGETFVENVRTAVMDITADPHRFGRFQDACRYLRLRRFPYVVLFKMIEDEVFMVGVLHVARSSDNWRERLQDT